MSLFKKFRKVIAVMVIAVMSVISLPIGSVLEAATPITVGIRCLTGENGWVYVADANNNPPYSYELTITGSVADLTKIASDLKAALTTKMYNFTSTSKIQVNYFNRKTVSTDVQSGKIYVLLQLTNIDQVGANKKISVYASANGTYSNVAYSSPFEVKARDYVKPYLVLGNPTPNTVTVGGSVTMTIAACDNVAVDQFNITENSIVLNGFTADKKLSGTGNNRTLTLSNIQGTAGQKTIYVSGAILSDTYGNIGDAKTSTAFTLNAQSNNNDNNGGNNGGNNANNNTGTNAGNIVINNNVIVNSRPADWVENPYTGL